MGAGPKTMMEEFAERSDELLNKLAEHVAEHTAWLKAVHHALGHTNGGGLIEPTEVWSALYKATDVSKCETALDIILAVNELKNLALQYGPQQHAGTAWEVLQQSLGRLPVTPPDEPAPTQT